ncbi:carbamoyl-phosphate synthase large subunit [Marinilabiliaceae bacterium ANBcel2]|nr:carbamoyl-phosphate synthase large subunit [Marinilabiliaceae bacterium ANBcel2]
MPKRDDIKKILIIGSGPIVIGQACEFDYSGTQACKALRSLGYEIVLVNSNPATIMTDPEMADFTYIEPLNEYAVTEIIKKERPDALLPNLGGQTALNLSLDLSKKGILSKYDVEVIGVNLQAIEKGEDRTEFKKSMASLNIEMARSTAVTTIEAAEKVAEDLGYPVVIRPAYTMGGTGGGLVYNVEELRTVAARGIAASMIDQILIEESVLGWEELELEVVRDISGKMITVCFIENVDPVGVHTGDSFCTAPMLTITEEVQKKLQDYAYRIVEDVGVIGGTNVQFAHDPKTGRVVVIEINPRTSRSSALASKATGFPIALISAMLACGITLDELPYWREGTLDKYTPGGDYVVVKFAKWAFEKFDGLQDKLGTQMQAVGEVMSIGRNYKEAFQKAIRSLETGRYGLGFARNYNALSLDELMQTLNVTSSERQYVIYEAFRKGATVEMIHDRTSIKAWFLEQMKELVDFEEKILKYSFSELPDSLFLEAKKSGFADKYLSKIFDTPEKEVRERRVKLKIEESWEPVPVSGVEDAAYYYSTYNGADGEDVADDVDNSKKIMVLGGGPNRIGQGIEFDYCCVHAAFSIRESGAESIMVNCNPETVSTDYDTAGKLYFEPLTVEDVLSIYNKEKPDGVICQFGGQTPLNIARELEENGVKIIGTSPETIDMAEDRDQFRMIMEKLNIPMPPAGMAFTEEEAVKIASRIGYPLMVRPSYVLGGRGMKIVSDEEMLRQYVKAASVEVSPDRPLLIDKFLNDAIEAEADAIADGTDAFVPAVMQHIEYAGVHSGDSACVIPPVKISDEQIKTIEDYTRRIAMEMKVVGLMNIQYAIFEGEVYILEANPRASRTVPLVSKICNIPMAKIATQLMLGKKLFDFNLKKPQFSHFGVKEAVFPFNMFPDVDPVLGPEMLSTGEVLGMADTFGMAFFKSQEATKLNLPVEGNVLITIADRNKDEIVEIASRFKEMGFGIIATKGTRKFLSEKGIASREVMKVHEGRPNIVDLLKNGDINLVINTPAGKQSSFDDSYIRKSAIRHNVLYITTTAAALAATSGIKERRQANYSVKSLQDYHKEIKWF